MAYYSGDRPHEWLCPAEKQLWYDPRTWLAFLLVLISFFPLCAVALAVLLYLALR